MAIRKLLLLSLSVSDSTTTGAFFPLGISDFFLSGMLDQPFP